MTVVVHGFGRADRSPAKAVGLSITKVREARSRDSIRPVELGAEGQRLPFETMEVADLGTSRQLTHFLPILWLGRLSGRSPRAEPWPSGPPSCRSRRRRPMTGR